MHLIPVIEIIKNKYVDCENLVIDLLEMIENDNCVDSQIPESKYFPPQTNSCYVLIWHEE